jgi:hypothetical protein
MTMLLLLDEQQASAVRGESSTSAAAALVPIALTDGRYVLPVDVLDDPAHGEHFDLLRSLPTATLEELEPLFPQQEE